MKKSKRIFAAIFALLMTLSVFSVTAFAAVHPTPENPITYKYTVPVTAYDRYGRVCAETGHSGNDWFYVDFYYSKADCDAKKDPMASEEFWTDNKGQASVTYSDTFVKDPPAKLYFKVRPAADVIFTTPTREPYGYVYAYPA